MLTPTRELCIQVTQALRAYGERKGVDVVAVFGGAPIRSQQAQLRAGGHIVVGTVGRVKDLISRHSLMLNACRFVVLDEADEMLDLGFLEDVERILSLTPSSRQTALFSATMPPEIRRLAEQYLYDPVTIKVATATLTVDTVEQFALEVQPREKADQLVEVLEAERPDQAIVFVRTKIRCDQLYRTLRDRGMNVRALHGDMTQGARDGVMISFKDGRLPLLVATDVAARGLDISGVSHVINYDVPTSPDVYVHRIGRTGRVGRSGRAITFYEPRQRREIEAIEKHAGVKLAPGSRTRTSRRPRDHEAATALQAARLGNGDGPATKLIVAAGAPPGSSRRTSSTRSPPPAGWTARRSVTSRARAVRVRGGPRATGATDLARGRRHRDQRSVAASRAANDSGVRPRPRSATPRGAPCSKVIQGPLLGLKATTEVTRCVCTRSSGAAPRRQW